MNMAYLSSMEPTRVLAGFASVALLVFSLVALLPDCAHACTCGGGGSFREAAMGANSSAVFSGEVIDVEKSLGAPSSATLRVSEVWKGRERETVEVHTGQFLPGVSCGYSFKEGREYLVYAYWGPQGSPPRPGLKTDICTLTKPLSEADANLRVLGEGQSSEGEPLPDTSGGIAGHGVVGIAAVSAATAGYLLLRRLLALRRLPQGKF
jgi:hypothetical protein